MMPIGKCGGMWSHIRNPVREIPLMWFVSYCIADAPLEIGCTSAQSVTLVIKQALRNCLLLTDVKNFWINVKKRLLYDISANRLGGDGIRFSLTGTGRKDA